MKTLILLILFTSVMVGQDTTLSIGGGITFGGMISPPSRFYVFNALTIDADSGKITFLKSPDSAGIIFARWFQDTYSFRFDSLKQENTKLKFLYKEALRLAREYRKQIKKGE